MKFLPSLGLTRFTLLFKSRLPRQHATYLRMIAVLYHHRQAALHLDTTFLQFLTVNAQFGLLRNGGPQLAYEVGYVFFRRGLSRFFRQNIKWNHERVFWSNVFMFIEKGKNTIDSRKIYIHCQPSVEARPFERQSFVFVPPLICRVKCHDSPYSGIYTY